MAQDNKKYAAVLIRLGAGIRTDIKDTLDMLKLRKKNGCVVLDANPVSRGMLAKCKDFIAYGELDSETEALLKEKRGKAGKEAAGEKSSIQFYPLQPPRGGYGRKGIKVPFSKGGAAGYRKDKIRDLIRKMV